MYEWVQIDDQNSGMGLSFVGFWGAPWYTPCTRPPPMDRGIDKSPSHQQKKSVPRSPSLSPQAQSYRTLVSSPVIPTIVFVWNLHPPYDNSEILQNKWQPGSSTSPDAFQYLTISTTNGRSTAAFLLKFDTQQSAAHSASQLRKTCNTNTGSDSKKHLRTAQIFRKILGYWSPTQALQHVPSGFQEGIYDALHGWGIYYTYDHGDLTDDHG